MDTQEKNKRFLLNTDGKKEKNFMQNEVTEGWNFGVLVRNSFVSIEPFSNKVVSQTRTYVLQEQFSRMRTCVVRGHEQNHRS
ncbi:MAG: hypothetical protein D6813_15150 [Calditrichaeota bacterium]|nr:MAG: hypothetical protein D6813_15150 [Calditrichota bacterium]